ncbi:Hypothetical_protein [Hexamita inflata]|uniref:Hypothetical_protein n=1 Tax=Hexamita inflata TaxID=28002 RepID=A0AA86REI0_9EUKA|nr:Hypothetical protein HINF_LOCUS63784 [Hexamita inflata]CAI9976140.1 Hypothetical protein HINF_LOCUS63785 [Hexamita inflata]
MSFNPIQPKIGFGFPAPGGLQQPSMGFGNATAKPTGFGAAQPTTNAPAMGFGNAGQKPTFQPAYGFPGPTSNGTAGGFGNAKPAVIGPTGFGNAAAGNAPAGGFAMNKPATTFGAQKEEEKKEVKYEAIDAKTEEAPNIVGYDFSKPVGIIVSNVENSAKQVEQNSKQASKVEQGKDQNEKTTGFGVQKQVFNAETLQFKNEKTDCKKLAQQHTNEQIEKQIEKQDKPVLEIKFNKGLDISNKYKEQCVCFNNYQIVSPKLLQEYFNVLKISYSIKQLLNSSQLLTFNQFSNYENDNLFVVIKQQQQSKITLIQLINRKIIQLNITQEAIDIKNPKSIVQQQLPPFSMKVNGIIIANSLQLVLQFLVDQTMFLVVQVPINDCLSPFVNNTEFYNLQKTFKVIIMWADTETVTLFISQKFVKTYEITNLNGIVNVEPLHTNEIYKLFNPESRQSNETNIINISAQGIYPPVQNNMKVKYYTNKESVLQIVKDTIQSGQEYIRHDILFVNLQDVTQAKAMFDCSILQFNFICFNINKSVLNNLISQFPMNLKVIEKSEDEFVNVLIGEDILKPQFYSIKLDDVELSPKKEPFQLSEEINSEKLADHLKLCAEWLKQVQRYHFSINLPLTIQGESFDAIAEEFELLIQKSKLIKSNSEINKCVLNGIAALVEEWVQLLKKQE